MKQRCIVPEEQQKIVKFSVKCLKNLPSEDCTADLYRRVRSVMIEEREGEMSPPPLPGFTGQNNVT